MRPSFEDHPPKERNLLGKVVMGVLTLILALLLGIIIFSAVQGCSHLTVTPAAVHADTPSYSGNDANGGFLGFLPDGSGHLTAGAEARYEALLAKGYAKGLALPIPGPLDGLARQSDGTWGIDLEHLTLFGQMMRRFRAGYKP